MRIHADDDITEAGRRAHEAVTMHQLFGDWDSIKDKWVAVKLSDGTSDGVLYDSKRDAVRHQLSEYQCAYICYRSLGPAPRSAKDMTIYLDFCRKAYDAGFRLPDPDDVNGGPNVVMTATRYDDYTGKIRPRV